MSEGKKRVFWNNEEMAQVGRRMAEVLHQHPGYPLLQAVREAQLVLPEDRHRKIIAWSVVQANIEPHLLAAKAEIEARGGVLPAAAPSTPPTAVTAEPVLPSTAAAEPSAEPAAESRAVAPETAGPLPVPGAPVAVAVADLGAPSDWLEPRPAIPQAQAAASATGIEQPKQGLTPPEGLEAAPVSPASGFSAAQMQTLREIATDAANQAVRNLLRDDSLALQLAAALREPILDTVSKALAHALPHSGANTGARTSLGSKGAEKVLLAGYKPEDQQRLENLLSVPVHFKLWKPNDSPALLQSHARSCRIAVVAEALGEEAAEHVKHLGPEHVLRHEGQLVSVADSLEQLL